MPSPSNDIDIVRQHVEDLFTAHAREHELEQRALIIAREGTEKALERALAAMDKRLEGMNEFRATISDISSKTVSRAEWTTAHQALSDKTEERFRALERLVYMATGGVMLMGVVVNLIMYFIKGR